MKITRTQLEKLIREEMQNLDEIDLAQAFQQKQQAKAGQAPAAGAAVKPQKSGGTGIAMMRMLKRYQEKLADYSEPGANVSPAEVFKLKQQIVKLKQMMQKQGAQQESKTEITKAPLEKIIKEELENNEALLDAIGKLTGKIQGLGQGIEDLDISIDFLSAAFVGGDPKSIGGAQKSIGRAYMPRMPVPDRQAQSEPRREHKKITNSRLKLIVKEELEALLGEEELSMADEFGISDEEAADISAQNAELFWGPRGEIYIRHYPSEEERPYRRREDEPDYERDVEL